MLYVHRAERADRLVDALAEVLVTPLPDPMATELVAVHSRGIERWLAQELSLRLGTAPGRGDGVCANVEFPFPGRLVSRAVSSVTGGDPDEDPWRPERLVWPLLALVGDHLDDERLAILRGHLGGPDDETRRTRRFGAVRRLADLFDRYAVHRPAMLRAWAAGHDVDGADQPRPLGEGAAWQPYLWRLVRGRVGVESPAERLEEAIARLRAGDDPGLPDRVALFGMTALPESYLEVLGAVAVHRDVHLLLLHPSPALWAKVAAQLGPAGLHPVPREADPTRELPAHPLLAAWGRDAREMQLVVGPVEAERHDALTNPVGAERHHALTDPEPTTLLGRIQADVRADHRPPGPPPTGHGDDRRLVLEPDDRSLQVHACHGRSRQVEVLRDALLHLLAADPGLEPRDIVVMCPDIEAFAPIIHAVFGARAADETAATATTPESAGAAAEAAAGSPGADGHLPDLRVRLADRSIRQTNPVLRVVADLLAIADGRLGASEVLDLAGREPVRRRFRFDAAALERLEAWVAGAGIRWGLDGDHRGAFGLDGIADNTWRAGLDRLLLGVTMADEDDRIVDGTVPLDDVEGGDVDLAGRFAEYLDRVASTLDLLREAQPVGAWRDALLAAADALLTTGEADRWQHLQLARILQEVVVEAGGDEAPSDVPLSLAEIRVLLEDRLQGRPTRASHRTGDLTICTLVPMRSVPHKVVCLLGMDDAAFPRRTMRDGDDLVDVDPRTGDRDPRTEDRQLLLDALLAARRTLVVTYTGRDARTNEPRPPAVPIGELLDVVDRTARRPDGRNARSQVLVEHPLQPFDWRNFTADELVAGRPWGFDPVALAGARARRRDRAAVPAFLDGPLAEVEGLDEIDLADLVRFLDHPVKAFLRHRLEVSLPAGGDVPADAIPVELSPLEDYAVGDRLLLASLGGTDIERWTAVERARGTLPPGRLADRVVADICDTVEAILRVARRFGDPAAQRIPEPVRLELGDGSCLTGAVPPPGAGVLLSVQYSRVRAKHRLAAWAHLLAATATWPDDPITAVLVGRCRHSGKKTTPVTVATLSPLGESAEARRAAALRHLGVLVDLYRRGLREPLPLYCRTSACYAAARHEGTEPGEAAEAARTEWTTEWRFPKEDLDPEHALVLGATVPLEALLEQPPRDDEALWAVDEQHRFGAYARRLWDGLLGAEDLVDDRAEEAEEQVEA